MSDTILKVKSRDRDFTTIANATIRDDTLSLKAKGLLSLLLSYPPEWQIIFEHIVSQSKDGEKAVRSAFQELKKAGYAVLVQKRAGGRAAGTGWVIAETTEILKTAISELHRDSQKQRSPKAEIAVSQSYKDISSKKIEKEKNTQPVLFSDDVMGSNGVGLYGSIPFFSLFKIHPHLFLLLRKEGFINAWENFVDSRGGLKKLSSAAANMILNRLAERPDQAIAALTETIERGWKTFKWTWLDERRQLQRNPERKTPTKLYPLPL